MPRYKFSLLGVILVLVFLAYGCTVRTYTTTKDRVDLELKGNRGYLQGTAAAAEKKSGSTTRDIHVMEIEMGSPIISQKTTRPKTEEISVPKQEIVEEDIFEEPQVEEQKPTYTTYQVMKDDTLQKISKKFYGTYKNWKKIYEANKDKISNPDRIKPGIIINIPE